MNAQKPTGTTHYLSSAIDSVKQEETDAFRRVDETKEQVRRAQADHDTAVQWADSIHQAIQTILEVTSHAKSMTLSDRIVFTLQIGQPLRVREIVERITDGGWETKSADSVATTRAAVSRLLSSGLIVREAHGLYTVPEITDDLTEVSV